MDTIFSLYFIEKLFPHSTGLFCRAIRVTVRQHSSTFHPSPFVSSPQHLVSQRHTALREGRPDPAQHDSALARKGRVKVGLKNSWFW